MPDKFFKIYYLRLLLLGLFLVPLGNTATALAAGANDKGGRGYWLTRYGEISPESDPLSKRAHDVFSNVLKASNRKKGLDPELIIINYEGRPWAQSLADGTVVLTKNALDLSYRNVNPAAGDSRLAFVIGHELAHQFNGDFWHHLFFQANEAKTPEKTRAFDQIREIARDPRNFLAKEFQADQYGAIYASVAGYDIDAVIARDKNLFEEWARAMDPDGYFRGSGRHPSSKQRTAAVISRLQEVTRHLSIFRAGVVSYYIGMYQESVAMMEEFARLYPSREVYNNLGAAYLALAYRNYRLGKGAKAIPFRLSYGITPHTNAESIEVARSDGNEEGEHLRAFSRLIQKAGEYLKRATESGYGYVLSMNNLGCAYILQGKDYEAVAILEEALTFQPEAKQVLNNRGIANYYMAEKLKAPQLKARAEADFKKALSIDKRFYEAARNLSIIKGEIEPASIITLPHGLYEAVPGETIPNEKRGGEELSGLVKIGSPAPKGIIKKSHLHEIVTGGRNNITIYDIPEKGMTIVERNGLVMTMMLRDPIALKLYIDSLTAKGHKPDHTFYSGHREIKMYNSLGFGAEFINDKAAMGFFFRRDS